METREFKKKLIKSIVVLVIYCILFLIWDMEVSGLKDKGLGIIYSFSLFIFICFGLGEYITGLAFDEETKEFTYILTGIFNAFWGITGTLISGYSFNLLLSIIGLLIGISMLFESYKNYRYPYHPTIW